jgi:LacI family transcriptional regulator
VSAKQANIKDIAAAAGVSTAAVSRVLNDGSVSAKTREKVESAIEALNYRPRTAARELRGHASTIGLLVADVTNPFFSKLADRVVWEARSRDVQVVLMTTQEDSQVELDAIRTLQSRGVNGIIATPTSGNPELWKKVTAQNTPVVFVDRMLEGVPDAHHVGLSNEMVAKRATSELLARGHSRIALISGPSESSTGQQRVKGFLAGHREAGIEPDPNLIIEIPFRGDSGFEAASALLAMKQRPSALLIGNNAQAYHVMRRILLAQLNLPEELSVITFGDDPWTQVVSPALTAVRQPIELLAAHAVELAVRGYGPAQRLILESELVIRASLAVNSNRRF